MASPRLICKSAYITDINYYFNLLEYSGNKIAQQSIVYRDGSMREVDTETRIVLSKGELESVVGIDVIFKDGGHKVISYERYHGKTTEKQEVITVSDVVEVRDDIKRFEVGSGPHEMKDLNFYKYLSYIEGRPGVEKEDGHGLFGLNGNTSIEAAKALALEHEKSTKWSHIISMDADDAKATGFGHRDPWHDLIVSKAPEICMAYNISMNNLVLDCAFHGNTDNPHVHLMFYSKDHTEGFVKGGEVGMNTATEKLKSILVNEIFKNETATLGKKKSEYRQQLMSKLQEHVAEITAVPVNEPFLTELEQLSIKLDTVKGKRFYEYLPPELKQEVDDILHMAVEQTPQLEQLFGEYAKVQEQMIARYISTPERLSEKLSEWKEHFYHPRKKDLRSQHNLIIAAAAQLSEGRNLRLRAFEEQTVDVTTPDLDMSSGSFGDDGDDDGYAVCEEPPPLPTDLDDLRAFEEQNVDVTTPQPIMSSESFGDAEEYAIWEEPPPLPTDMDDLRAFEEQNVDVTMPQPVMSSILYENPTKQQAFEKQITDDFYQVFRKAMQEIFNPKVPNTSLQQYVVEQLEALQATKQLPKALGHQNNIFRAVYSTDEAYCNDVHTVLERMAAAIIEEQGDFSGRQHLIEAEESLRCGHAPSPYLLSSFSKYASRLDDQRYYQLLGAFRELNRPLNKTIHKALDAALPQNVEQRQVLADIADVAEYIKDSKPCEDFVKQSIRNIMESMSDNEEYSTALLEYKRAFGEVFTRYMPRDNAGRYAERFSKTYDNVLMLMRPHYTFVDCAEHLDDISYRHIMQDKELQHPLKKLLRCQLDECLGDEQSFSAVWVRRQLERCKDNPREASQLFAYLYETSEDMRKLVDNQIGVLYDKLKTVMSPAAASAFSEQYREELLHGQFIPIHNSINFYGRNLDENYYHVLSQKHKQIFHGLNREVAKGLWQAVDSSDRLKELRQLQSEIKAATENKGMDADAAAASEAAINHRVRQFLTTLLGENKLLSYTESIAKAFQVAIANEDIDPNLALALYERVRSDVYSMELPSVNYMVRSFATELDTHLAESFLKKQLKHDAVRQFRSELYCAVRQMHTKDLPCKERVQLLSIYAGDRKCYNEILELLSPQGEENFHSKQENLYLILFNDYCATADNPLDYNAFRKVADTFFYGENGNTFFFQEPVQATAADMAMPLPTIFIVKTLLKGLARCITNAAAGAHDNKHQNSEHSFRTQKQFHNIRFHRPEQFAEY